MIKRVKSLGVVNLAGESGVLLCVEADSLREINHFANKNVLNFNEVLSVKTLPPECGVSQ